jgi:hypothetical protein
MLREHLGFNREHRKPSFLARTAKPYKSSRVSYYEGVILSRIVIAISGKRLARNGKHDDRSLCFGATSSLANAKVRVSSY